MPADAPSLVRAQVVRILPFGLLVTLEDGRAGIIREREIAWDADTRRAWRRRFAVGDWLLAVPLGDGYDQRVELSLRLAENDPWNSLEGRYPLGSLVAGTVTGVQSYGAFVELEPGVTGLLHQSRLPAWSQQRSLELVFSPGDRVQVVVERLDPGNRHVGLSLARALNLRWQGEATPPSLARSTAPQATGSDARSETTQAPELPPVRIVMVEDDPVQREAVVRWMQRMGLDVRACASAEEAIVLIEQQPPDLVLTDFGLPGMNGAGVLTYVHERHPLIDRALMTDWARANEHAEAIERLYDTGVRLLVKPLQPADLVDLLTSLGASADRPAPSSPVELALPPADLPAIRPARHRQLEDLLVRLCGLTGAAKCVLFMLDPAQRKVSVVAEVGAPVLNQDAMVDLIHSPVRDVAEDRIVLRVDDAQLVEGLVRYLVPLLPFRSCLGVPVQTDLYEHDALFLFSPQPGTFSDSHEEVVRAAALAAGALHEREQVQANAEELQRLALMGQLSRALAHELNHRLSPINFTLSDINQQFGQLEQGLEHGAANLRRDADAMRRTLDDLREGVKALTDTAVMFGRLAVQMREQVVDMAEVVAGSLQLLRDMADRAHIVLDVDLPPEPPPMRARLVQLQQIVLNLVINAIQQIDLARPGLGGRVRVAVEPHERDHQTLVRLTVEDDGPGVHRQHWQRIFDLGFTTRVDGGSGLGLYITRGLTEALGGRVFVEESFILWGTRFVVELPVAAQ